MAPFHHPFHFSFFSYVIRLSSFSRSSNSEFTYGEFTSMHPRIHFLFSISFQRQEYSSSLEYVCLTRFFISIFLFGSGFLFFLHHLSYLTTPFFIIFSFQRPGLEKSSPVVIFVIWRCLCESGKASTAIKINLALL